MLKSILKNEKTALLSTFIMFMAIIFAVIILIVFAKIVAERNTSPNIEIDFTGGNWNANQYIASGVSGCEDTFTWSDGKEVLFYPIKLEKGSLYVMKMKIQGTYNGNQEVQVYMNDTCLYSDIVSEATEIFMKLGRIDEDESEFKIILPKAISPQEIEQTGDTRVLALMLNHILITKQ